LDGSDVPSSYRNGPVFDFVANTPATQIDLTDALTPETKLPLLHYTYFSIPDITMQSKPMCRDELATGTEEMKAYAYLQARSLASVTFQLSERYGWATAPRVCQQVNAGVSLLDGVTTQGDQLLEFYREAPFSCSTTDQPCVLPGVFNPNTSFTTVTYLFATGDIQTSSFAQGAGGEGPHSQPSFSRTLLYKLAGSVLDYKPLHFVLLGTKAIPGSLSLTYPPWDALYILRDPPGGGSAAQLDVSNSLATETSLTVDRTNTKSGTLMAGLTADLETETCLGLGAAVCTGTIAVEAEALVGGRQGETSSKAAEENLREELTFSTGAITSNHPNFVRRGAHQQQTHRWQAGGQVGRQVGRRRERAQWSKGGSSACVCFVCAFIFLSLVPFLGEWFG
jgi:hypothetical protein